MLAIFVVRAGQEGLPKAKETGFMELVLLLPLLFIVHDSEEIITQRKWMERDSGRIVERFPAAGRMVSMLSGVSDRSFSLMVMEELAVISLAVWLDAIGVAWPLVGLFYGFGLHLVVHVGQGVAMRSYVPGLVTSVVEIPVVAYIAVGLWSEYTVVENLMLALGGVLFAGVNVFLIHWVGKRLEGE